jgi:hypothetical protein
LKDTDLAALPDSEAREVFGDIVVSFSSFIQMRKFHNGAFIQAVIEEIRNLTNNYTDSNRYHPRQLGELFLTYLRIKHHL